MDVRLQELCAASLGGDGKDMQPAWAMALEADFGSVDGWREDVVAQARSRAGVPGWLVLAFQPRDGTLANRWTAEDAMLRDAEVPLLALDMSGIGAADGAIDVELLNAWLGHIDWSGVYARYQAAVHDASEPFAAAQSQAEGRRVVDVRRAGAYRQDAQRIAGAQWRDPARVSEWAGELPAGSEVVVYCVYGHEVGRATALRLRAAGLDARFLAGGIDAWKSAGRALEDKPQEGAR